MRVNTGGIAIKKYWSLEFPGSDHNYSTDIREVSEKFADLFEDAVRLRLRADVPVAAYFPHGRWPPVPDPMTITS